jgi:hypothetical protein
MKEVVRVDLSNNFNCTLAEFNQLEGLSMAYPNKHFFVNSNIKTPNLSELKKHNFKGVITVNPDLKVNERLVDKLYSIKNKVSFVRVKYLPNSPEIEALIRKLSKDGFKVVITVQRFNGFKNLDKFSDRKYYEKSFGKMRLKSRYYNVVCRFADKIKNVYICDRKHTGCSDCGLCAKLNGVNNGDLSSINLSTSGLCGFSCVDCFARTMQNFLIKCNKNPIEFDVIKKNKKQLGNNKYNIAHKKGNKK